jgi:hypothetical protein
MSLAQEERGPILLILAQEAALATLFLHRIAEEKAKAHAHTPPGLGPDLVQALHRLERYERQALARRARALTALDAAANLPTAASNRVTANLPGAPELTADGGTHPKSLGSAPARNDVNTTKCAERSQLAPKMQHEH